MSKFKAKYVPVSIIGILIGILIGVITKWGCPPTPPAQPDPPITMARFVNKTKRAIRIDAPPAQPDTVVTEVKVDTPPPTNLVWGDDEATILDAPYLVKANKSKDIVISPPAHVGTTYKIDVVVKFEDIAGDEPADLPLAVEIDPAADEDFRSGFKVIVKEWPGTMNGEEGIYYNAMLIATYVVGTAPDVYIVTDDETAFLPNP